MMEKLIHIQDKANSFSLLEFIRPLTEVRGVITLQGLGVLLLFLVLTMNSFSKNKTTSSQLPSPQGEGLGVRSTVYIQSYPF